VVDGLREVQVVPLHVQKKKTGNGVSRHVKQLSRNWLVFNGPRGVHVVSLHGEQGPAEQVVAQQMTDSLSLDCTQPVCAAAGSPLAFQT
jgi:hypothetical protein